MQLFVHYVHYIYKYAFEKEEQVPYDIFHDRNNNKKI